MEIKNTIILILILMTATTAVAADPEQYLTAGVTKDNTYSQDGTGYWNARTPVTYQRTGTIQSYFPIVGDVNNDSRQDIIIINNGILEILNFTSGTGLVLQASYAQGNPASAEQYYPTPYLFDWDEDNITEVITLNYTHMQVIGWNGTAMVLERNATTNLNTTAAGKVAFQKPVIKCANSNQWSTGKDTCVTILMNRSGASAIPTILFYNVDDNTITTGVEAAIPNADSHFKNTHLFDGDGDGFLEAYWAYNDIANGKLIIYGFYPNGTNFTSYTQDEAANMPFTDIIVNRLDGINPSITWGYSADGTNFDAYTISGTGVLVDASYCTVLTCPEGDVLGINMWEDDGTYADYSGDVCYYLRNYEESDPGANIDTVHCISRYAGADTQETEISNTHNFSGKPLVHLVNIEGSKGLLTQRFLISGSTVDYAQGMVETDACVPVDPAGSGSLDIICANSSLVKYFDDAYTNQNVNIESISLDTGMPMCLNEVLTFDVSVTDDESDVGDCVLQEKYANSTFISNHSSVSFTASPTATSQYLHYLGDAVGTYYIDVLCRDQYHDTYENKTKSVRVANLTCGETGCYCKGLGGTVDYYYANATASDEEFLNGIDRSLANMGVSSGKAKAVLWLVIMAIVIFGVLLAFNHAGVGGGTALWGLLFIGLCLLLVGWYLGFVGTIVLVILGLLIALVLTLTIMVKMGGD